VRGRVRIRRFWALEPAEVPEDSSELMIGPVRRRNALRLGIVLLALSALVSVVACALDEPQQPSELMIAASVATGPGLWKLLVGRVTPFAGGTRTGRTLNSPLLNEKLDSGHPERGGFARAEITDWLSSGWFSREELGNSGV